MVCERDELAFRLQARALESALPRLVYKDDKRKGFVLVVFGLDVPDGQADYISNADQPDIIRALREMADRLEANPDARGKPRGVCASLRCEDNKCGRCTAAPGCHCHGGEI